MIDKSIFFKIYDVLKRDKLINMVAGARGIGKTYTTLKYAVEKYKETKKSSIYLRRYKTELKKFATIFNPLYANNDIDATKYQIDSTGKKLIEIETGNVVIEAIALSVATNLKSASFNTCDLVIFDEFILDKSTLHYIDGEFELFNNFIETIARLGELTENRVVKVLMLANAGSRNNPYFMGYNIPIFTGEWYVNDDLLVYYPDTETFKKVKLKTRWGRFVSKHTNMSEYMLDGTFKDKNDFIEKLPQKTSYVATLKYLNKKIGVYLDLYNGKLFISEKVNPNNTYLYALTNMDSTPNYLVLTKGSSLFKSIKKYWESGSLRFTNLKIQTIFMEILKII